MGLCARRRLRRPFVFTANEVDGADGAHNLRAPLSITNAALFRFRFYNGSVRAPKFDRKFMSEIGLKFLEKFRKSIMPRDVIHSLSASVLDVATATVGRKPRDVESPGSARIEGPPTHDPSVVTSGDLIQPFPRAQIGAE
jgi:hypothetical protein